MTRCPIDGPRLLHAWGISVWCTCIAAVLLLTSLPTPVHATEDTRGSTAYCEDPGTSSGPGLQTNNNIMTFETQYAVDYARAGVGGMRNVGSATIALAGVSGAVSKAYLYWSGPTNTTVPTANASVFVDGIPIIGTNIGFSDNNCWGFNNSQAYRADVTLIVQTKLGGPNGSYALTGFGSGPPVNTNGASLLVFFNDGNPLNNRDVVLFDGNDSNIPNIYDAPGWNVSLPGINYTAGTADMELHVADGQSFPDDALTLNAATLEPVGAIFQGTSVPSANPGPTGNGSLWDIRNWDVTSYLSPGPNTLTLTTGVVSDCLSLHVAAINLPAGAAPNQPPICDAGGPYTAETCVRPQQCIQLDGSGTTDPDTPVLSYAWTSDCPGATFDDSTSATPILCVDTSAPADVVCMVTLTVSDGDNERSCSSDVFLPCRNLPPDCSNAVACVATLWPPNHKYNEVSICGVTDPEGDPVTITVTSITQDEPLNTRGDGNTCPDAQLSPPAVRAERTGTPGIPGNGRVYAVNFTASDPSGAECSGTVFVCVPHDQGEHSTCIDDGQRYDSTGPCTAANGLAPEAVSLKVAEVSTTQANITFALPTDTDVEISVFDVAGRRLATLENTRLATGVYDRAWSLVGVPSGMYFVRLRANDISLVKPVLNLH